MKSGNDPDLVAQIETAYKGKLPAHIIFCKSPLSAYLARDVFQEIIRGAFPFYDIGHTSRGDLKLPAVVRCFIHAMWHSANSDFRDRLEQTIKNQTKIRVVNHSFEGAVSVVSEVADKVWETVKAMLNDEDLFGLEMCVGENLEEYKSGRKEETVRAIIFSEEPDKSAFDAYIRTEPRELIHRFPQFPQLRDIVDGRELFNNIGHYGKRYQQPDGFYTSGRFSEFCFLVGTYNKQGAVWHRIREPQQISSSYEKNRVIGGCFFPHSIFCWVGDAPEKIILDEQNRPHNLNGWAWEYQDGWHIYATEGVRVSSSKFEQEQNILNILGERNLQVQRTMIEKYGTQRFLKEFNATVVHEDDYGKLWKTENPISFFSKKNLESGFAGFQRITNSGAVSAYRFEGFAFVEVLNKTPEADGSFKDYFLRVPFEIKTAREAVAWTFNKNVSNYKPVVET